MDALHLLMTNNVFQFGDTFWLQKVGIAMGAPPAPPWTTIFFGIHEETVLAIFGARLQLYCRFIDDVLGIWLVDPDPAEEDCVPRGCWWRSHRCAHFLKPKRVSKLEDVVGH